MNDIAGLRRILIFDDDSDFRKLLLLRLRKMFSEVELVEYDPIAKGVPDADFDWSAYDVLLLDYFLCIHGVTGLDILIKNRKNPQFPATIMLTGAGNEEIAVRALKSGVSDYIRKETLDKEELRKAILNAYEEHKVERKRSNDATLHGHAFNKALFYQQLETPAADHKHRVLLLIQLDGHEKLASGASLIVRDNVVRHIAKQAFEVFQFGNCNPSITRFSEVAIGLLIDDPESRKTLEFNLDGLCKHLQKRPYKYDGKKYRFSVSIGVVALADAHNSAEAFTQMANAAVASASAKSTENSYVIHAATRAAEEAASAVKSEAAVTAPAPEAADNRPPLPAANDDEDGVAAKPETAKAEVPATAPAAAASVAAQAASAATQTGAKPATSPLADDKKAAPVKKGSQSQLDDTALDLAGLEIKRSFEENRVVQTFQPLISLTAEEEENATELYDTTLQLIDADGTPLTAAELYARVGDEVVLHKYIDRWMLREAIGRAVNSAHDRFVFLMKISDASLADATLFNWLRDLLSGLGAKQPGDAVVLEISASSFSSRQKQAEALMTYLRKSHGFKFMLAHIDNVETLKSLTRKTRFDLLKVSPALITELSETAADNDEEGGTLLSSLKNRNMNIVVRDVEDATTLTEVISMGADYAIGDFIGEASTLLDDMTNVESFEIS